MKRERDESFVQGTGCTSHSAVSGPKKSLNSYILLMNYDERVSIESGIMLCVTGRTARKKNSTRFSPPFFIQGKLSITNHEQSSF